MFLLSQKLLQCCIHIAYNIISPHFSMEKKYISSLSLGNPIHSRISDTAQRLPAALPRERSGGSDERGAVAFLREPVGESLSESRSMRASLNESMWKILCNNLYKRHFILYNEYINS